VKNSDLPPPLANGFGPWFTAKNSFAALL